MNKKGTEMNIVVKILLFITGFITIFSGANSIWIGTGRESLVRMITSNIGLAMQIFYIVMGLGCLVTTIFLAMKIIKK
jgi:hypothetical protein